MWISSHCAIHLKLVYYCMSTIIEENKNIKIFLKRKKDIGGRETTQILTIFQVKIKARTKIEVVGKERIKAESTKEHLEGVMKSYCNNGDR